MAPCKRAVPSHVDTTAFAADERRHPRAAEHHDPVLLDYARTSGHWLATGLLQAWMAGGRRYSSEVQEPQQPNPTAADQRMPAELPERPHPTALPVVERLRAP